MLYDLNVVWKPTTPAGDLERTLKFAKSLGYDVVALNHIVNAPIPSQITNPVPLLTPPPPSYPNPPDVTNLSTTSSVTPKSILPTTLRRVTIVVTDPVTTNYRLTDFASKYDLVAVRPTTDKAFQWACLSVGDSPSLISLDLTSYFPFHFHPRTTMAAVKRGLRFEISYAQALASGDARARSNFIANTLSLLRATKGRGIVASSEASGALELRGPADVVNLLAVWGLGPEKGMEALGVMARAVVVNEGIKRRGFRGVIDVLEAADTDGEKRANVAKDGKGKKTKASGTDAGEATEKGKQQGATQGQKRKNGEGDVAGEAETLGQVTLSKRQAKKLKREALKGAKS